MPVANRSRVFAVAAALVLLFEGGMTVLEAEAFCLPAGLATQRHRLLPKDGEHTDHRAGFDDHAHKMVWKHSQALRSFKFIKGETQYGDLLEGTVNNGMLGGPSSVGFGGSTSLGGNSLSRGGAGRRRQAKTAWWNSMSGFSRNTRTTLLAAGSLESWPVMEADDIQVLVRKGDDLEANSNSDRKHAANDPSSSSSSVRATLERWERDISLEVIGRDGYPMLGNELQPGGYNNNNNNGYGADNGSDRCTQSIKFDVTNGDVYPFSGTISVPPPLTVEDSMGNQQTVMMVLNNPDEDETDGNQFPQQQQQQQYDEYGNPLPSSGPKKPSSVEAKLEPLFKSPDQKYAEAQEQQSLQYDEWGNEIYNPNQPQKTTIPSNGYQSFELDATDPATGKIKIELERESGGGGGFGFGGGNSNDSSEARVEIYHGFKDQYGNPYNNHFGDEAEDRRISLEVSTLHPTFSSVVDTMPTNLLAKHALPSTDNLDFLRPYLEVRIVNTGGAALKAGVQSFLPQYRPQNQKERQNRQLERQKYERQQLASQQFGSTASSSMGSASTVKADDPFLLVDSAQSTTSTRRMKNTNSNNSFGQDQKTYVRASSSSTYNNNGSNSINEMWSTGARSNNNNSYNRNTQGMPRPAQDPYYNNDPFAAGSSGMKADTPGADLLGKNKQAETSVTANPLRQYQPRSRSRNNVNGSNNNSFNNNGNSYSNYNNNNNNGYYNEYDAIDTVATSKNGNTGLIANNDFTKANGSKTSAIVPGSKTSDTRGMGVRRVSPSSTTLRSFGGNSGDASGMQQNYSRQSQQTFGIEQVKQAFQDKTAPQKTRNDSYPRGKQEPYRQQQRERRSSSAFAGNGNVIGNGVIAGRPAAATSAFRDGNNNRRMPNNNNNNDAGDFGGRLGGSNNRNNNRINNNSGFQQVSSSNRRNNQAYPNSRRTTNNRNGGRSSFTPPPSNNFGGNDDFGTASFGGSSMKDQVQQNDSFSTRDTFGNNNNNRGGGPMKKLFGGNNNNNNSNSGSPFGNLGAPPSTRGNTKNPFATLNGEKSQPSNSFGSNNNNNSFGANGGGGGGAPQRPLSPKPTAMKNPFAGLNGNNNNNNNNGFGGNTVSGIGDYGTSTTAMRSSSNMDDYGADDENPIVGMAKNVMKSIGDTLGTNR